MKSFVKLFGIIALTAVIGFSMVACDNDNGGGSGSGGTLTVTGVPSEYTDGSHYASFTSSPGLFFGYANVTGGMEDGVFTYVRITSSTVALPVWGYNMMDDKFVRNSRSEPNETVNLVIYDSDNVPELFRVFTSVNFTNGNANIAWADGVDDSY